MTQLRRGDYRDPAIILEEREARTCAGCQSLITQCYMGTKKFVCTKAVQKSALAVTEMSRCRLYRSQS